MKGPLVLVLVATCHLALWGVGDAASVRTKRGEISSELRDLIGALGQLSDTDGFENPDPEHVQKFLSSKLVSAPPPVPPKPAIVATTPKPPVKPPIVPATVPPKPPIQTPKPPPKPAAILAPKPPVILPPNPPATQPPPPPAPQTPKPPPPQPPKPPVIPPPAPQTPKPPAPQTPNPPIGPPALKPAVLPTPKPKPIPTGVKKPVKWNRPVGAVFGQPAKMPTVSKPKPPGKRPSWLKQKP